MIAQNFYWPAVILLAISALFFPFWLTALIFVISNLLFDNFFPGLIILFLMDVLYGFETHKIGPFFGFIFVYGLATYFLIKLIKERLIFVER